MLSQQEYKTKKEKDLDFAFEIEDIIHNSKDKDVRYKDSRPIMDLKHMIETSASEKWYADNIAMHQKFNRKGKFETITYRQLLKMINALGTALIDLGMKDKRISVTGNNCSQWAVSYLAAVCGVGVVVPLDKELHIDDIEGLIVRADTRCVLFSGEHEKMYREIVERGKTNLELLVNLDADEDSEGVFSYKKLIEKGEKLLDEGDRRFLDAQIDADEMAILLFTSGTTGKPKGVMLSHKNITSDLMLAPTYLKVNPWDVFFSVLPLHHTYACTCDFLMPLYKGASIAYCEGLKYIVKNMQEVKPTMFLMVPAILEMLHKKISKNIAAQGKTNLVRRIMRINAITKKIGLDLSHKAFKKVHEIFGGNMRLFICGGAAINPQILLDVQGIGIMALQGYGLTECAPMGALNPVVNPNEKSVGKAFPACEIKIDSPDEDGIGEILIKGPNVMLGYYEMPDETTKVLDDGWLRSGDLGYLDDKGFLIITGRLKNVIIAANGKNVFPEELEYHLSNVDIIKESMVFEDDQKDGNDVLIAAAIFLDEEEVAEKYGDLSREEIEKVVWGEVDKINSRQPFFKRIKRIILRDHELVKNTSKKILRFSEENKK